MLSPTDNRPTPDPVAEMEIADRWYYSSTEPERGSSAQTFNRSPEEFHLAWVDFIAIRQLHYLQCDAPQKTWPLRHPSHLLAEADPEVIQDAILQWMGTCILLKDFKAMIGV